MYNKSTEGYGRRTIDGGGAIKCKGLPPYPEGAIKRRRFLYREQDLCYENSYGMVCKKKIPSINTILF
jgi:hypothetical protein